jgi:propanol-preferring alcohol dehydrogenase
MAARPGQPDSREITMDGWIVDTPGPIGTGPLRRANLPDPVPREGQLRIRVTCCGVCRTDLHLAEGDLPPHAPGIVPGHEVVGTVETVGENVAGFSPGDRVGVPWLARTCSRCAWCRAGRENLCARPAFTGWDVHGGYAQLCVADADFAYRLPAGLGDLMSAPLLCAGIIGYRALRLASVPPGGRLGIYGFGGSAHLTVQLALRQGLRVHVLTRGEANRELALRLGVDSAGPAAGAPPEPLDGAILFAPAGDVVPVALRALDRGGTLAVAGIWLSDVPTLDYTAELFGEKRLCSVTANTRQDGTEFLTLAERLGVRPTITSYPFAEADRALTDLARGTFSGAAVLTVDS